MATREAIVSDWAKRMADGLRRRDESANIGAARALQVGQLLDSLAPEKWSELRNTTMQKCTELNAEHGMNGRLTYDPSKPEALVVQNTKAGNEFRMSFSRETHRVSITGSVERNYQLRVKDGARDLDFFQITTKGLPQPATPSERIAEETLEAFLAS